MYKIAFHPIYKHPLPEGHRFPMEKYELIPEQLLHEGTVSKDFFFDPHPYLDLAEEGIQMTHSSKFMEALKSGSLSKKAARKIGFPYSPSLLKREEVITAGSIRGSLKAMEDGVAFNIAGGTHHAYRSHGEGFCIYNDIACASNYLLHNRKVKQILVVDLDVHQGNGTASLFEGQSNVFTFSMHGAKNYPAKKEKSDLDIALPNGTTEDTYLPILREQLLKLINKVKPDFIFYQCGVDVLANDQLGKLSLSMEGCRERDAIVLSTAHKHSIPVMAVMGGGYSKVLREIIDAHSNTYRLAYEIYV